MFLRKKNKNLIFLLYIYKKINKKMPAKSQQQLKFIYAKRNQYGSEAETPEKWKWIWEPAWTKVKAKKLPKKKKKKVTEQNIRYIIREILEKHFFSEAENEEMQNLIKQKDVVDKKILAPLEDMLTGEKRALAIQQQGDPDLDARMRAFKVAQVKNTEDRIEQVKDVSKGLEKSIEQQELEDKATEDLEKKTPEEETPERLESPLPPEVV